MLIYIVDDDATARDSLTRMLRTQHHEVVAFPSAVATTDYITLHSAPDAALIDFKLESWPNGINLAKQLRLRYPTMAIVVISAYATAKDVAIAFRQGADDFLLRPIDAEELLNSVSEAVLHHRPALPPMASDTGALRLDSDTRRAYWHDVDLNLTPTELAMLTQLVARPGVVMNFAELYSAIHGEHLSPQDARKRLKSHVSNLKHKLRDAAPQVGNPIRTSWGQGLSWDSDDTDTLDVELR